LLDLLTLVEEAGGDEEDRGDATILDMFDRAAWSFHAGPDAWYLGPGSVSWHLARLRAREWFLLEFELTSGLTPAEEWIIEHEGEPGSGGERRAVERFVNSECGVFDVEDVGADGWLRLAPILGGDRIRARPIERGSEMVPGWVEGLPHFATGDTIAGRLYWLDDDRAELSAGTDRISAGAKASLAADPPAVQALRSGLVVETLFGADAARLLSATGDVRFPQLVAELLLALSDGTFDYWRLWSELEGESDPVALTRQMLAELNEWTVVEQVLLANAVAGAWLRRREATAGRAAAPATLERERHALEEHVRTVLDAPGDPELLLPSNTRRLAMSPEDRAEIAALRSDAIEWVVDVRHDDRVFSDRIRPVSEPYPLICAVVEQDVDPFDIVEGGDEGEAGDEDGEPQLIEEARVGAEDDETEVALELLVGALRGREEGLPRPQRIVFRQRRVAARLDETLRDAGFDVTLRYFSDVVDAAMLDLVDDEQEDDVRKRPVAGRPVDAGQRLSEEEQRLYRRLLTEGTRCREGLESLAATVPETDPAPIVVTPAQPVAFPFATLEGDESRVGSFAIVPRSRRGGVMVEVYFVPPAAGAALDFRGRDGEALLLRSDWVMLDVGEVGWMDAEHVRDMTAAGWPCGREGLCVVGVRQRPLASAAFLREAEIDVMAGVMEAVAALIERLDEDLLWEESGAVDVRVEPFGDAKVEWRAPWPR
jgi:hypothetical protein